MSNLAKLAKPSCVHRPPDHRSPPRSSDSSQPTARCVRVAVHRRGNVTVLGAFMIVVLIAMAAMAIDLGVLATARTELQRSADASALAATWELMSHKQTAGSSDQAVRNVAIAFAGHNRVIGAPLGLDANLSKDPQGDLVIGYMADPSNEDASMNFLDARKFNAVRVTTRRSHGFNGQAPLFFARIWGINDAASDAQATAVFLQSFRGFHPPPGKNGPENLPFLPFALSEEAWKAATASQCPDQIGWNAGKVTGQPDGIPEIHLYPLATGSGGNYGTVDVGSNNSTTPTLRRQITDGATPADLDFHGGELKLDERGELAVSADPGLKLGAIRGELTSIIGQPRMIPLYRSVSGSGNPAMYTIVGFAGVRVVSVKLSGGAKSVKVQPAPMIVKGGIPAEPGDDPSHSIYSAVYLVK